MRRAAPWVVLALALAFPLAMQAEHQTYYLSFASRIFIYALAATSLNLVLGYGGMISFGHAAFVGTGAYVAAILVSEGVERLACLAGRGRRRRRSGCGDRCDLAAHARRVLHHDHPRVRADDVLPRELDEDVRRGRRP